MSRWRPELLRRRARLLLGIDSAQLAWRDAGRPDSVQHASHDALGPLLDGSGVARVDAVVANDLARHWVQTPPASVASFAELRQVAAVRCAHLHGGTPEQWRVTADWSTSRPFMCAALPASLVADVQRDAARAGVKVQWHTAWGLLGSRRAHAMPDQGWTALRTPARLALWHCTRGRVDTFANLIIDPQWSHMQAAQRAFEHVRVAQRQAGLDSPGPVGWLHWNAFAAVEVLPGTTPVPLMLGSDGGQEARSEAAAAWRMGSLLAGSRA